MSPRKHGTGAHKKAQQLEIGAGTRLHLGSRCLRGTSNSILGTPPASQPLTPDIQRDAFDRLASALLDSPTPEKRHPNGLASHPTNYAARASSRMLVKSESCLVPRGLNEPLHSDKHLRVLRSFSSQDPFDPRSAESRRPFPGCPPQTFFHPTRGQVHPPVHSSESGPLDSIPTPHLDLQEPQFNERGPNQPPKRRSQRRGLPGRLPTSSTAPLHGASGAQIMNSVTNQRDAQQKLRGMLSERGRMAASNSSKEPFTPRRSRVARLSQRISTKVSDVWSRIQGKGSEPATNILKISAPMELQGGYTGLPHPFRNLHVPQYFPDAITDAHSPVATVDLSDRIPIPSSTKPLATGWPPSPNPIQLAFNGEVVLPAAESNPFENTTEFDDDLEGVLPELPLAASTPRLRRKKAFRFDESPPIKRIKLGTSPAMAPPRESSSSTKHERVVGSKLARSSRSLNITPPIQLRPGDPEVLTKKHPSPSKSDLDGMAFRLRELGFRRREDDLDELARPMPRPWSSRETLAPRDKNQPIRRLGGKTEEGEESLTPVSTRKTRIPCPHGSTRSDPRLGLVNHPQDPKACEVDELALF
ncbi:hypothetical protein SODALDRAFT_81761 [Sodiomyces alkalinus F11]|uniref:Uncharacterized protein n=1 Tax=Sodiomyces alkalinus (strain CBS 110278 / VKM F-3762 / F11) TaxID=1314773 RepID=A0A3N2PJZ5_SODAK|nr:hypothetical protein SODALDRAFT_81761 [Sodiomyces alkalinus F11]ROT34636.1 hypothetical protein SODALDRAFT_81761 [Sodiomyces alkalinus F11]